MPVRMLTRRLPLAALLAAAMLVVTASAVSAAPQVSIAGATAVGDTVTVQGTAVFPPITEAQSVVGVEAFPQAGAVGGSDAGNMAGLKLVDARIVPISDGLRFTWVVEDMPDQGIPPEIVRYTWGFKVKGRLFQLQAKSTNVASSTTVEDPVGHAQQAAGQRPFFQLRGACTTSYLGTPIQGCYHLAFLQGAVDPAANTISVDLPFNTRDSIGRLVAPEFVPGEVLQDNAGDGTAGMSIAASFQAVVSNTATSQYINGYDSWFIGEHLDVAVAQAGLNPATVTYTTKASRDGDAFSATLTRASATHNTVYVRACHGTQCAFATRLIGT